MLNTKNAEEYDNYLRQYVNHYIVSIFKGRGKYAKVAFENLNDAVDYRDNLKSANPNAKCVVYGISQPPHTVLNVSIAMEV